ncbi:hypothetical protein MNBD_GAMMA01-2214 [hydrothermal vent metagenome]|uniref:Card1 endonuclease domain-containing protein n=1 Tax=hydrothermal vent metagenome TaxID=652676 RepID=A0A3B0VIE2_9ZZZZ
MNVMNVHLAIYDSKNAGIASAALHLNPDKVILLHRKQHDIEGIKSVLNSRGIKCHSQMVSFDPKQIRTILKHIFLENQDNNLVFNASAGYRMMVLVTLEQFTSRAMTAFVVDKFTNQLHWLHPSGKASDELAVKLKIHEYLKLFASQVLNKGKTITEPQARQALTNWLIENIEQFGSPLAAMNHIAMRADISMQYHLDKGQRKRKHLQQILTRFEEIGLLKIYQNKIVFKNEESRFYANGGWLENHVFSTLFNMRQSRKTISDLATGMEIVRAKGTIKNEIDVIAMANNRLHLIECKTRKFTNKNHANTPGSAAIYRLDTLKESLGGNSGKAMLISYQKLSRYTEQRAKDLGIYCCSYSQLKQLQHHLFKFIDSTNLY